MRLAIYSCYTFCLIQLPDGPVNDGDSFDTEDRLSGSIPYDDDDDQGEVPLDRTAPPPATEYETIRRDDKKSRKKEVCSEEIFISFHIQFHGQEANTKRQQREREKEEKKERKKSQSRTRSNNERDSQAGSNYRSKARIIMLDDSTEYVDLGVGDRCSRFIPFVCSNMRSLNLLERRCG